MNHSRFADDTVRTVTVAECLLRGGSYIDLFHECYRLYPQRRLWRLVQTMG
ncbi:MAG: hypothetical protein NZ700_10555 [Gemmataceae bacterium]|nr:hypothetical protein [Gemmataceae bacterium]MDW8266957.1 hypothetical protein [Gemmataceae bacterium]